MRFPGQIETPDDNDCSLLLSINHGSTNHVMYVGIMLESAEGEKIGESKIAARQGISMVILSRIGMATPGMVSSNPCL